MSNYYGSHNVFVQYLIGKAHVVTETGLIISRMYNEFGRCFLIVHQQKGNVLWKKLNSGSRIFSRC